MYYYVVEYWDNLDQESRTDSGVISTENYSAAADKVEEYYGSENIVELKLSKLEEILSEDELMDMFESKEN